MKGDPTTPRHLMGIGELAKRFGVSRHRATQLAAKPSFPTPYDVLLMGRVWTIEDVEAWAKIYRNN